MTLSAFGVEHEGAVAKRDYSHAAERWERHGRRADLVENTAGGVAGVAGAAVGGAALRDAAFRDKPARKPVMVARVGTGRLGRTLVHGKPGFKTLATAAGATAVSRIATADKKVAEAKGRRYRAMTEVAKAEPLSNRRLERKKKVQAGLTVAGSTLGLAALGSKGAAVVLPKVSQIGRTPRGQAYVRRLHQAATNLTTTAAGVGGASGFNFAAVQREEARRLHKGLEDGDAFHAAELELIAKAGDWQTIDQRELKARRARRTQRRGAAAAYLGGATVVGAAAKDPSALEGAANLARGIRRQGIRLVPHSRPTAVAALGGTVLAGAGAAGWAQGKGREQYHQHKINQRRRVRRLAAQPVTKAYDPEARRERREVARTTVLGAGSAAAAGRVVRNNVARKRVVRLQEGMRAKSDSYWARGKERQNVAAGQVREGHAAHQRAANLRGAAFSSTQAKGDRLFAAGKESMAGAAYSRRLGARMGARANGLRLPSRAGKAAAASAGLAGLAVLSERDRRAHRRYGPLHPGGAPARVKAPRPSVPDRSEGFAAGQRERLLPSTSEQDARLGDALERKRERLRQVL